MSAVRNPLVAAVVLVLLVVFGACSAEIADIAETTAVPETTAVVSTETPVGTVAPDVAGLAAGHHTVSLAHGGRDRSYIVHVPAGVTVPAPVVVALHGGGGTGEGFQDENNLDAGGEGPPFPGTNRTIVHAPVMESIESWATVQNRCEAGPDTGPVVEAAAPNDGQTTTLLQWNGCADGAPFDHLRLTGSGHGWPGVTVGRLWQNLLGPPTTVIDASAEVWAFVSEFSR
jgi:poly(3-hydroxybutyrate) depolymerase